MIKLKSLLPLALISLLAVSSAHAQAIVGAWTYGNTLSPSSTGTSTFVFLANGVYFHAESDNTADVANGPTDTTGDTGLGGMERGTYTWNSGTSLLTLNSVPVNTNGQWGLSHDPGVGNTISLAVAGDTMTVDGGPMTMSRVTGGSAIVGGWTYGNTLTPDIHGTGTFVFLPNGVYFHAESDNTYDAANGPSTIGDTGLGGMERGTYSWNSGTSTFNVNSLIVNTNGQWGLSHDPGVGFSVSMVVTGDTLTVDGSTTLTRVSAIPEPSTYAAFAGLGALGLATWRRRRTTAA